MIPVNDLRRHSTQVAENLKKAAAEVLASGNFVLGPKTLEFEERFAAYCGARYCIGVGNGTDALELALRGMGVQKGDGVLLAANAAMYGTTAALAVGAEPLYVDVDPEFGLLTNAAIEEALGSGLVAPRAIIVTHLYGQLADIEAIIAIGARFGIPVLEDCAQAHGARASNGRRAGSFGAASAFSFYPTKNLGAIGDGGAVCTNDSGIAERIRQLRQYGWTAKYRTEFAGGRNSRLDEIQAAMLIEQLQSLDNRNNRRRLIAETYSRSIRHPDIQVPVVLGESSVAHLYVVKCRDRDTLRNHLHDCGVSTDVHYPVPDHRQPVHQGRFADVHLPVTEKLCETVLTLPCFPELTDEEVVHVVKSCNSWKPQP